MKQPPSREVLIKEFKQKYKVEPTEMMLEQYRKRRPVNVHFKEEERKAMRERVPKLEAYLRIKRILKD